jgi:hypothetical protein
LLGSLALNLFRMSKFGGWRGLGRAIALAWVAGISAKLVLDLISVSSHDTRVAVGVTATTIGLVVGFTGAFYERRRIERDQNAFQERPEHPHVK